jgi:hypothetical protein
MTSTSGPPNAVLRIARMRNPPPALREHAPPG